ncbi:MAG: helix-turn-helix domain-containing protein [Ruminococcus bromii]|nr:helix-turn-helix domain-containing protein [Ruminococcus bromii]MCI7211713.1 helix-turn-helix domain-containing protein [Ruminococcus bromii]MDD6434473.1 helix-turn-helix transcriptional regulator [Ruminococcus bromii]MDY4084500.1 helix-turn-helix transcriptional regulator [Ruminococcus bromii]MDY4711152.1 helix-turn-helix transcriptional regulator [Ruminococcus bromii]
MTFGSYIFEKRKRKGLTIRRLSQLIEVSPSYVSGIENGSRSAPKYNILTKLSKALSLSGEEEAEMMDLAAKSKSYPTVAGDIATYISEHEVVNKALRAAKEKNISEYEWINFIKHISARN